MGNFACTKCGGEFFIPLHSTFTCPNCHDTLPDITPQIQEQVQGTVASTTLGFGSMGEPITEWVVGQDPLEAEVKKVMTRALDIWRERQVKYGPSNIAATGTLGCFVRATDKLARLREVYLNQKGADVPDESVVDSWLDLLNYAAMGVMCHEGNWPGVNR